MTDNTTPNRAAGLVTVQLGQDLKRDWIHWCKERGLVPGKAVRQLVERALTGDLELSVPSSSSAVVAKVGKVPDTGPKVGREIYFTPSENTAITEVSTSQGFGFHEWVVAAVRGALAKAPSYGQVELEALTKSNLALMQIAYELAAIRKAGESSDVIEKLPALEGAVKQHVEKSSAAMAQGAQRWQLKV